MVTLSAKAAETPVFGAVLSPRLEKALQAALSSQGSPGSASIARVDLNGDNEDEYIARAQCEAAISPFCSFIALAERPGGFVTLAVLRAKRIEIDDKTTEGVRNILAYDSPDNDYRSALYIWEPASSRYIMKEDRQIVRPNAKN